MPKILMLTTDQMIDRRILLESDALAVDGWEVAILAMPGAAQDHPRVVRAHASVSASLGTRERAIISVYRMLRRRMSLNGAVARRLKSFIWRNLISPDEFARASWFRAPAITIATWLWRTICRYCRRR